MIKTLCILALFCLLIGTAQATFLPPGATVVPGIFPYAGPVLADTGKMAYSFGSPLSSGTVEELVVADGLNPFGAGDLSFIYQVDVAGGDVGRLTGSDFKGWLTDVAVSPGILPLDPGAFIPSTADRTADGSVVGFNFATHLVTGQESLALIIRTNATLFGAGSIGVIDGGGTTLVGFAPSPEPAFAGLMLGGLFAAGLFLTRRFRASQS